MTTPTPETPITFWADELIQKICDKLRSGLIPGNRVTDVQVSNSSALRAAANEYVRTYTGANEFMRSLCDYQRRYPTLSYGQMRGALNFMLSSYMRSASAIDAAVAQYLNPAPAEQPATTPSTGLEPDPSLVTPFSLRYPTNEPLAAVTPVVHDGTFTVVIDETGTYRTIRVTTCTPEDRARLKVPEGAQFIAFLSGPDNESSYTGCGYLFGSTIKLSSKYRTTDSTLMAALAILVSSDRERQIDLGHAYAMQSGRCWRCGRTLTVPASINRGMGPVCAEKL